MLSAAGISTATIRYVTLSSTSLPNGTIRPKEADSFISNSWLETALSPAVPISTTSPGGISVAKLILEAETADKPEEDDSTGDVQAPKFSDTEEEKPGPMSRDVQATRTVESWVTRTLLSFPEAEPNLLSPEVPELAETGKNPSDTLPDDQNPTIYPYTSPNSVSFVSGRLLIMRNLIEREYLGGAPFNAVLAEFQRRGKTVLNPSEAAPEASLPNWTDICEGHPHMRPYKAVSHSIEFSKQMFRDALPNLYPFAQFVRRDVAEHVYLVRNQLVDKDMLFESVLPKLGPFRFPSYAGKTLPRPISLYLAHKIRDAAIYSLPVMLKANDMQNTLTATASKSLSAHGPATESNPVAGARVSLDCKSYREANSVSIVCLLSSKVVVGGAPLYYPVELSHGEIGCSSKVCPLSLEYERALRFSSMTSPEGSVLDLGLQLPRLFSTDALLYSAYVPLRALFSSLLSTCVYIYGDLQQPVVPVSDLLPYTTGVGLFYDPRDAEFVRSNPTLQYSMYPDAGSPATSLPSNKTHSFLFDYERAARMFVDRLGYDIVGGKVQARVSSNFAMCAPSVLRGIARATRLSPERMDKTVIVVADSASIHLPTGTGRRLARQASVTWQPLIHQKVPRLFNQSTGRYEVDFQREIQMIHLSCGLALISREHPEFDSSVRAAVPDDPYRRACYSSPMSIVIGNADGENDAPGADSPSGGSDHPAAWDRPESYGVLHGAFGVVTM